MAIAKCPTSGEYCNFIPVFASEDAALPEYTQYCKTRTETTGQGLVSFCGIYVELKERLAAAAQGGNE